MTTYPWTGGVGGTGGDPFVPAKFNALSKLVLTGYVTSRALSFHIGDLSGTATNIIRHKSALPQYMTMFVSYDDISGAVGGGATMTAARDGVIIVSQAHGSSDGISRLQTFTNNLFDTDQIFSASEISGPVGGHRNVHGMAVFIPQTIYRFKCPWPMRIESGEFYGWASTSSATATTITIYKNGVALGTTITDSGGSDSSGNVSSGKTTLGGSTFEFARDDILEMRFTSVTPGLTQLLWKLQVKWGVSP